jgi:hypothetical protein
MILAIGLDQKSITLYFGPQIIAQGQFQASASAPVPACSDRVVEQINQEYLKFPSLAHETTSGIAP